MVAGSPIRPPITPSVNPGARAVSWRNAPRTYGSDGMSAGVKPVAQPAEPAGTPPAEIPVAPGH